jgi:hypothetical protein
VRAFSVVPSALILATVTAWLPASAATPPVHVRGTITSVTSSSLTVQTANGPLSLAIDSTTGVAAVVPASRSDIKPNTFIGSANVPGSNGARALEVVIFPDSMRGMGEGDYPWDLPAGGHSSSMMTNGTVGSAPASHGSMMTNGTVTHAMTSGQMTITVNYKGGSKQIVVDANTPVVRIEPGNRALLVSGAHVFVIATSTGGHLTARRIVVGKDGAIPPM